MTELGTRLIFLVGALRSLRGEGSGFRSPLVGLHRPMAGSPGGGAGHRPEGHFLDVAVEINGLAFG
jgi:hypothetical protein